jgi:hypothetical protein
VATQEQHALTNMTTPQDYILHHIRFLESEQVPNAKETMREICLATKVHYLPVPDEKCDGVMTAMELQGRWVGWPLYSSRNGLTADGVPVAELPWIERAVFLTPGFRIDSEVTPQPNVYLSEAELSAVLALICIALEPNPD